MNSTRIAVVGATGYSGEELIRLLMRHPGIELACVTSRSGAGQRLDAVFPQFQSRRFCDLKFSNSDVDSIVSSSAQIAFLALPHGAAAKFAKSLLDAGLRVIDLSADFRIKDAEVYKDFYGHTHPAPDLLAQSVYGLPEIYRAQIKDARLVASPGCYPTSIILPLYPFLKQKLIDPRSIVVTSLSGVSGAGRKAEIDYLFAECNENARAYGVPKHRHLAEIEQELSAAAGETVVINFTPHLIPLTRGILTTIYAMPDEAMSTKEILDLPEALYEAFHDKSFVRLRGEENFVEIKNVTHTNFVDIAWRLDPRTRRIILLSAEDNLVKGASGQAIQSMNLMCGLAEDTGLL